MIQQEYILPTINILTKYNVSDEDDFIAELLLIKNRIIDVFKSEKVQVIKVIGKVNAFNNLFEITLDKSLPKSSYSYFQSKISRALNVNNVFIMTSVNSPNAIDFKVPSNNPSVVTLRYLFSLKKFKETTFRLPVVLGETTNADVALIDLIKAQHVLIVGSNWHGISRLLKCIISSLLYKKMPHQLKFVMINLNYTGLNNYSDISQYYLTKIPEEAKSVISDADKIPKLIKYLISEVHARLELLDKTECTSIKEYNKKFFQQGLVTEDNHRYLPFVVVIIDELGKFIKAAPNLSTLAINNIVESAHKVGVHLIIASQNAHSLSDTKELIAKFPTKVVFKLDSEEASHLLLKSPDARFLNDDMLVDLDNEITRVQGASVDIKELERINNYISSQMICFPSYVLTKPKGWSMPIFSQLPIKLKDLLNKLN